MQSDLKMLSNNVGLINGTLGKSVSKVLHFEFDGTEHKYIVGTIMSWCRGFPLIEIAETAVWSLEDNEVNNWCLLSTVLNFS